MPIEYTHICVLGPGKAGSTWFYSVMRNHPQVCVPNIKESYFFANNFSKGRNWYENMFEFNSNTRVFGDFSNQNIFNDSVIENCESIYSGTIYFVFMRDPLSRFVSSYLFEKQIGFTGGVSDFVNYMGGLERFDNNKLVSKVVNCRRSIYYYIINFDDIVSRPQILIDDVCKLLGISDIDLDQLKLQENPSLKPRLSILSKFGKIISLKLRRMEFYSFLQFLKESKLVRSFFYTDSKAMISEADMEVAKNLIPEAFSYSGEYGLKHN